MSEQSKLLGLGEIGAGFRSPKILFDETDVPEDWTFSEASSVSDIKTGHTPSREIDEYWEGDIPWIAIHDLSNNDGVEIQETDEQISQEGLDNSGAKLLPEGTLVICRTGSIGESAILGKQMATDQSTVSLEPHNGITNPYFLKYLFSNHQSKLERLSIGSTHPSIQLHFFPDLVIPIPPIDEQRKIASVLYRVDQLLQKTREVIDQTHRVKSGVLQDVFHGKHEGVDQYESTPVGEIPPHWEVASIGDVVHTAQYGISQSLSEQGRYPIFRMNNIENGYMVNEPMKYIDLDKGDFEKYHVKKGDVLFNRTNSLELVGKTGIYELDGNHVFASYLVRLQTNERANPYYLNYYMNSAEGQNRMREFATKGVSQANINANSIQQVKLPLPPLDDQKEIADKIRSFDEQIEVNNQFKFQLRRLKQGLLQCLLSGEVRTQDKDIEIAEEVMAYD